MNIAIYIRYNDYYDKEQLEEKLKVLKKYCKENNYNIIKEYYDDVPISPYMSQQVRKIIADSNDSKYHRVIACDINDFGYEYNQIYAIYTILDDMEIKIETINQGIIGEDIIFEKVCFETIQTKKELLNPKFVSNYHLLAPYEKDYCDFYYPNS